MAKQNGKAVAAKVAAVAKVQVANTATVGDGPVPRGVVSQLQGGNGQHTGKVLQLVSTHRRQYVVIVDGKAVCYFTASMALGHTNAVQRFVTGSYKAHAVKAAHTDRLANMGVLH